MVASPLQVYRVGGEFTWLSERNQSESLVYKRVFDRIASELDNLPKSHASEDNRNGYNQQPRRSAAHDTAEHGRSGAHHTPEHGRSGAHHTPEHGRSAAHHTPEHGRSAAHHTPEHGPAAAHHTP